jgi:hypothetical protein
VQKLSKAFKEFLYIVKKLKMKAMRKKSTMKERVKGRHALITYKMVLRI